jgi:hypothetical protein
VVLNGFFLAGLSLLLAGLHDVGFDAYNFALGIS